MDFKRLLGKAKNILTEVQHKAEGFSQSETYKEGVSIFKESWQKLKNKRIKIEDVTEQAEESPAPEKKVAKKAAAEKKATTTKKTPTKNTTAKKAPVKKTTVKKTTTAKKTPVKKESAKA